MELTLTFKRDLLREAAAGQGHDLRALVRTIPSARYLSGNPKYSIRLAIDESRLDELRRAVDGRCTISDVTDLDLLHG